MSKSGWALLSLPIVGAIVGYIAAALTNENCPTIEWYAGQCARAKPVHETLIGLGAGFGAMCLAWLVFKGIGNVRDSFIDVQKRIDDERDPD